MRIAYSSKATPSASRRQAKALTLDVMKPNLTSGRSPPRPMSIGMAGRHQSEQVADISPE
jgi:hypothetical protein